MSRCSHMIALRSNGRWPVADGCEAALALLSQAGETRVCTHALLNVAYSAPCYTPCFYIDP